MHDHAHSLRASGWRSRGYLPHFDVAGATQHIVFRLADSLPAEVIARLAEECREMSDIARRERLREQIDYYLDQNRGSCILREDRWADLVEKSLLHFDELRYRLCAWCIMPNHVHVIVEQLAGWPLSSVVHSWKSYTAHIIAREYLRHGRRVPTARDDNDVDQVWYREYFDRQMRNNGDFDETVSYVQMNPVKAGMVARPEMWRRSSAYLADDK